MPALGPRVEVHLIAPNGDFPNNPKLPALVYRSPLRLPGHGDAASADFHVVGAYAHGATYDMQQRGANDDAVRARIERVALPERDPVWGAHGPLVRHWTS